MNDQCNQCNVAIPQINQTTGEETCYHRCVECGNPHMGFFDMEKERPTDYRCLYCKEPFIYSWSILDSFMSCPKYAMFSIDLGRGKSTPAMAFGSALHEAFDVLQKTRDLDAGIIAFQESYGFPPEYETLRTREKGEGIIRAFWYKFKDNPLITSPPANEQSAAISIGDFLYSARIDRQPVVNGRKSILDYKSSTYFDRTPFLKTFDMSHQFTGYAYVASVISGSLIEDVDVLMVKVSKGTKARKAHELAAGREPYDDAYGFSVLPQARPSHMVERFIKTVQYVADWWCYCRATGFYPEFTGGCFRYNRDCEYLEYCKMPVEEAIPLLQVEFDLKYWDSIAGKETILAHAKGGPGR